MIYNILFEADKHWGATRPEEQYRSSYILKRLLADLKIDLFVSLGDFYDTKLLLNSRASVYALRDMHDRAEICRAKKIPMRVIRGTLSHDYDQLEAFSALMEDPKYDFRYFNHLTIEETLPEMRILYAPDENVNYRKWMDLYEESFGTDEIHMACCHGNFDVILAKVALDTMDADDSTTLAFHYQDMMRRIRGPIIAGHWHNCNHHQNLYYAGSPDRWIFGEDETKGYVLVRYDTEQYAYQFYKIPNFLASQFKTFEVYTSNYGDAMTYQHLIDAVEQSLDGSHNLKVRIKVIVDELYSDTEAQILNLKYHFATNKRVDIVIENKVKTAKKQEEKKQMDQMTEVYGFVKDKKTSVAKKIWLWIKVFYGKEYPLKQIEAIVNPELENR